MRVGGIPDVDHDQAVRHRDRPEEGAEHRLEALALLANYAGDNAYAVRAADAARAWIDERRDSAPQRTEQPTAPDEAES